MHSREPRRSERANALGAHTSYDLPPDAATLSSAGVRLSERRLERRAAIVPLGALFSELPAWFWWTYAGVLVLAMFAGALFGERAAMRAMHAGQSPTLAMLRERVRRLRAFAQLTPTWIEARGVKSDLQDLERGLLDLQTPYRPRRSENPALPPLRPLGVPDEYPRAE